MQAETSLPDRTVKVLQWIRRKPRAAARTVRLSKADARAPVQREATESSVFSKWERSKDYSGLNIPVKQDPVVIHLIGRIEIMSYTGLRW